MTWTSEQRKSAQDLYREADQTRASFGSNRDAAMRYYNEFVNFVDRTAGKTTATSGLALLDVGCGNGWSSFCFAASGFRATGIDLNASAFECPSHESLDMVEGSMLHLDFPDESFDVVVTYQCLEHVPDPREGLREMARVCRHGGVLCVVGPNLVTPTLGLRALAQEAATGHLRLRRDAAMPHHPGGNTALEHITSAVHSGTQLLISLCSETPRFCMRVPDLQPPFYGDNDACYLCQPLDLVRYFSQPGFQLLRNGKYGRSQVASLLATGTWIGARKL